MNVNSGSGSIRGETAGNPVVWCAAVCRCVGAWSGLLIKRLFPLKLCALCPKATGFDGGGVRRSVGQSGEGPLVQGSFCSASQLQ